MQLPYDLLSSLTIYISPSSILLPLNPLKRQYKIPWNDFLRSDLILSSLFIPGTLFGLEYCLKSCILKLLFFLSLTKSSFNKEFVWVLFPAPGKPTTIKLRVWIPGKLFLILLKIE